MVNDHYFTFPLSLLQLIKNDDPQEGLLKIIGFSTINFSHKLDYKIEKVGKRPVNHILQMPKLSSYISEKIQHD